MGIGMMMVVAKEDANKVVAALKEIDKQAAVIGEITKGNKGVILCED